MEVGAVFYASSIVWLAFQPPYMYSRKMRTMFTCKAKYLLTWIRDLASKLTYGITRVRVTWDVIP